MSKRVTSPSPKRQGKKVKKPPPPPPPPKVKTEVGSQEFVLCPDCKEEVEVMLDVTVIDSRVSITDKTVTCTNPKCQCPFVVKATITNYEGTVVDAICSADITITGESL